MSDLPTREEFDAMGNMDKADYCPDIANAWLSGELKTAEEFLDDFDYQAAINHLEWLHGLRLFVSSMLEVVSAGIDGEWGNV